MNHINVLLITAEPTGHRTMETLTVALDAADLRTHTWQAAVRVALGPRADRIQAMNVLAGPQHGCRYLVTLRPAAPLAADRRGRP